MVLAATVGLAWVASVALFWSLLASYYRGASRGTARLANAAALAVAYALFAAMVVVAHRLLVRPPAEAGSGPTVARRRVLVATMPARRRGVRDVVFRGVDGYTDTFPLAKAKDPTTLVAYEMNGEPLPHRHGFPVRIIVPGLYGEKNVKWIDRINLSATNEQGFYENQGWGPVRRPDPVSIHLAHVRPTIVHGPGEPGRNGLRR